MKKKILALALIILAIPIMSAIPVQAITWGEEDTTNTYENVGAIISHYPTYVYFFNVLEHWCTREMVTTALYSLLLHTAQNI